MLLCATDAGGVANLAPLVAPLQARGRRVVACRRRRRGAFEPATGRLTDVSPHEVDAVNACCAPAAVIAARLICQPGSFPDRRLARGVFE